MIAARQTSQTGQMSQVSQVSQVSRTGLAPRPLNPARLRSSSVSSLYTVYTFHTLHTRCPRPAAGGPAGGWFDLANFVATSSSNKTPFDDFAASIGKDIYIDVQGWHLFLRDVKISGADQSMAQALATKIGSDMMSSGRFDERDVEEVLKRTPVALGRGKVTVPLIDVIPNILVDDLYRKCEDFCREHC